MICLKNDALAFDHRLYFVLRKKLNMFSQSKNKCTCILLVYVIDNSVQSQIMSSNNTFKSHICYYMICSE